MENLGRRRMGANFSTAYEAKGLPTNTNEPAPTKTGEAKGLPSKTNESAAPTKKGQVIAFHSSSKWKIHFEASKQTSKLVTDVIFDLFCV